MGSVDAQPLEGGDGAIFEIDVRIMILVGKEVKLCDIMKDISGKTNIWDLKCLLSTAMSCSMYIINLLVGVEELFNACLLFRIGHQGDSLNLTMVKSMHCDQAGKELLSCAQRGKHACDGSAPREACRSKCYSCRRRY